MATWLLTAAMALVACGFFALALTDRPSVSSEHPGWRRAAIAGWWSILILGWAAFFYVALVAPGGLDVAWAWARAQSIAMQAAMWLLLLPWMVALLIWQAGWPEWLRWTAIIVLAVGWSSLAFGLDRTKQSAAP